MAIDPDRYLAANPQLGWSWARTVRTRFRRTSCFGVPVGSSEKYRRRPRSRLGQHFFALGDGRGADRYFREAYRLQCAMSIIIEPAAPAAAVRFG
jgi:hypothetical protein